MDRNGPALFALGVSLLLVTTPVYPLPHAGQPEYTHSIEHVPASEVPEQADVIQYTALSPEAKAAIRDARADDGVVYGNPNKPTEFIYSDAIGLNHGLYYLQQDGTYYRLTTFGGGPEGLFSLTLFLQWGLVLLGLGIGLLGYISLRTGRRSLPTTFGLYGGLVLVGSLLQPGQGAIFGKTVGPLLLLALILVGLVTALLTFGTTER